MFYDDVGRLVAHGVVDERAEHDTLTMPYFEDLAARARATSGAAIHAQLGLRRLPPPA